MDALRAPHVRTRGRVIGDAVIADGGATDITALIAPARVELAQGQNGGIEVAIVCTAGDRGADSPHHPLSVGRQGQHASWLGVWRARAAARRGKSWGGRRGWRAASSCASASARTGAVAGTRADTARPTGDDLKVTPSENQETAEDHTTKESRHAD